MITMGTIALDRAFFNSTVHNFSGTAFDVTSDHISTHTVLFPQRHQDWLCPSIDNLIMYISECDVLVKHLYENPVIGDHKISSTSSSVVRRFILALLFICGYQKDDVLCAAFLFAGSGFGILCIGWVPLAVHRTHSSPWR